MAEDVEKLQILRAEIDQGIRSLDAGKGKKLNMHDVIRQARDRHGEQQTPPSS